MKTPTNLGSARLGSDATLALALGLAAATLYVAGACRTIYVGDSGELVAAVWTLGIPHPTGYPLYVLLGHLWTHLLPWGAVALRMSLFSALFAGAAVALTYCAARALDASRAAAAAATGLFAVSPSFWGEANVQRVYALDAFFVALVTWLALRWLRVRPPSARSDRGFVGVAFLAGLGASNHVFVALWGLVFLALAIGGDPGLVRRGRTLAQAALAALAGLSVYLYLPWRARQQPRLDWGDPETLGRFLAVVTRHDFWSRRWLSAPRDLGPIAADFLSGFATELTIAGALLAVVGLGIGLRSRRPVLLPALVALANLALLALHGSRSDLFVWHRYYIPAYLSAALLAAVGLDAVATALARRWPPARRLVAVVALAGVAALVPLRFARFDRSHYRLAEDYSRMLLDSLPPGAHLAASDDNILFVLIYLQLVDHVRPDVDLVLQGVGGQLPPLHFDPDREPLFFTHHPNWRFPALEVVPVGLVYQVVRASAPLPPLRLPTRQRLDGEDDPRVPKDYLTQNLIGELHFMLGVTYERRDRERALAELADAARAAPDNDVLFYNLGLVYERMGLGERALAAFQRSAAINPRAIPGPSHVRAIDRVRELERGS